MSRKGDWECGRIYNLWWCYNALKFHDMMLDGVIGISEWCISSLILAKNGERHDMMGIIAIKRLALEVSSLYIHG